jgi:translation initiation factor IF-2
MADNVRLNKVLRELNISIDRAIDFLESKGIEIEKRPTTKISSQIYELLSGEFQTDASKKVESNEIGAAKQKEKEALRIKRELELEEKLKKDALANQVIKAKSPVERPKTVGKIDLDPVKSEEIEK